MEKKESESSHPQQQQQSHNCSLSEEELINLIDKINNSNLSSLTENEKEYLITINRMISFFNSFFNKNEFSHKIQCNII